MSSTDTGQPSPGSQSSNKASSSGLTNREKIAGFVFGLVFVTALLVFSVFIEDPTPAQYATFKTVLALAVAGVGGILGGVVHVEGALQKWSVRAGGAVALFVLVYFFSPAPPVLPDGASGVQQTIEEGGTGVVHAGEGDVNIDVRR